MQTTDGSRTIVLVCSEGEIGTFIHSTKLMFLPTSGQRSVLSAFHIDFSNPEMNQLVRSIRTGSRHRRKFTVPPVIKLPREVLRPPPTALSNICARPPKWSKVPRCVSSARTAAVVSPQPGAPDTCWSMNCWLEDHLLYGDYWTTKV